METCRECGGRIVLSESGEFVCSRCGLVHDENRLMGAQLGAYRPVQNPLELGTFLAVRIGDSGSGVDSRKFARLSRVNWHSKVHGDRSMQYRVLKTLERACIRLGIPELARDYAFSLYLKVAGALERKKERGRRLNHYRIAAACLLISARKHGLEVESGQVVETFRELGHRVRKSNFMEALALIRRTGEYWDLDLRARIEIWMAKALKRLVWNTSVRERIGSSPGLLEKRAFREALSMLERTDLRRLQGHNPHILALAYLYLALGRISRSRIVTQEELARTFGHSPSALRNCVKLVGSLLGKRA